MTSKRYQLGSLTVLWQAERCTHSARCFRGLPDVFDPRRRPWIQLEAASREAIVAQVAECPSGALSLVSADEAAGRGDEAAGDEVPRVEVSPSGPLVLHGEFCLVGRDGHTTTHSGKTALCRCGGSKNKPFCDGTHRKISFVDE